MILKVLLVLGVISIVYFMFIKKKPASVETNTKAKKTDDIQADDMVECATCGVYSEVSESLLSSAKYYCSKECIEKAV